MTAKLIAVDLAERAMRRLEQWMDSDKPQASIAACIAIIDRAEGKPHQSMAIETSTKRFVINARAEPLTAKEWEDRHSPLVKH